MKTIEIQDHFTPLDRSIFQNSEAYADYFRYLTHILNGLLSALKPEESGEPFEVQALNRHIQSFLNTVESLSYKYAFEDEHFMRVDLTESGFPNYLEIKKLHSDVERRLELLAQLESAEELKRDILDYLLEKKEHPGYLLKRMGRIRYLESLAENRVFNDFNEGKLVLIKELEDENQSRRFMYDWSSYDTVSNRPHIYILVFDEPRFSGKKKLPIVEEQLFREVVRRSTHNSAPLKVVASDLDEGLEFMYPKILKRIDLGPVFGNYSRDEHELTKLMKDLPAGEFLFQYTTETIFSVGEKRTGSFLSKGELRQVFFVDESNKECMDRMVSKVHKYILATHKSLRMLNDRMPEFVRELAAQPHVCKPVEYA